jgi:hypothetical protein
MALAVEMIVMRVAIDLTIVVAIVILAAIGIIIFVVIIIAVVVGIPRPEHLRSPVETLVQHWAWLLFRRALTYPHRCFGSCGCGCCC